MMMNDGRDERFERGGLETVSVGATRWAGGAVARCPVRGVVVVWRWGMRVLCCCERKAWVKFGCPVGRYNSHICFDV